MTAERNPDRRAAAAAPPRAAAEGRLPQAGPAERRRNPGALRRRVAKGERLEITDRGRPVALLLPTRAVAPVTPGMSPFERLVAEGRARMPVGHVIDLPPPEREVSTVASDAVIEAREERLP